MSVVPKSLDVAEFHTLLLPFALPLGARLAVAVSGGPDSTALAVLTKNWAEQNRFPLPLALIVDHGLRPESADEAGLVKSRMEKLGLEAKVLRWEHGPVASRLHNEARKARYRLLLNACQQNGISCLFFGHQREDQAETILMRLAKGTGIDGLAGIPAETRMEGVRIMRPLLRVSKERLVATCAATDVEYVTDPSNNLERFARGRLRRVMPLLQNEGLSVERLIDLGTRASEASDALDFYTSEFLHSASHQDEYGVISIDCKKLKAVPRAVALRSLSLALQTVHTEDYPPTHASLGLLLDAVKAENEMSPRTLNGCLISFRQGQVVIAREFSAVTEIMTIRDGESMAWDGRWRVSLMADAGSPTYEIRALGNLPHELIDRLCPDLRRQVPQGRVRSVLPVLYLGSSVAIIPFGPNHSGAKAELLAKWPTEL